MSSPTEQEEKSNDKKEKIPSDLIHCVQKLLSSVSTLSKHLSLLNIQQEPKDRSDELTSKLQVSKRYASPIDIYNSSVNPKVNKLI